MIYFILTGIILIHAETSTFKGNFKLCEPTENILLESSNNLYDEKIKSILIDMSIEDTEYELFEWDEQQLIIYKKSHILYEAKCTVIKEIFLEDKPYDKVRSFMSSSIFNFFITIFIFFCLTS